MAYPSSFYFATDKTAYTVGESVYLSGWAYDLDGYYNLYGVDWWIQNRDTGVWTNISDTYFDDSSAYSYWNDIYNTISGLGAGNYRVWGQAWDDQSQFSNSYFYDFSIYGSYSAPSSFYFATDKTAYTVGESVYLSGWAYDLDGYYNLYGVDWWIQNRDTGVWTNISDTYFDDSSAYSYWNDIYNTISGLGAGNYRVWGQAWDDQSQFSNSYFYDFSVYGSYSLSAYSSFSSTANEFYFSTDKSQYSLNEDVHVEGWAYDADGYDNLFAVDWWLYHKDTDKWSDLQDTYFDHDSDEIDWNDFQTVISSLDIGNYEVWGQAISDSSEVSDWYSYSFSVTENAGNDSINQELDLIYQSAYADDAIAVDSII